MTSSPHAPPPNLRGPGLAKSNVHRVWARRRAVLLQSIDGRWKEFFLLADTVSEGAVRHEKDGDVWYGSTSIVLRIPVTSPEEHELLTALSMHDPHVRLRAVRTAHREATLRAPAELDCLRCELHYVREPTGLRIDVDVQAALVGNHIRRTGAETQR
jgi:hypothetical protein